MVLAAHVADTPAGNPFAPLTPLFAIPVAPVVVWVIEVKAVFIHLVWGVAAVTVLFGMTVTDPVLVRVIAGTTDEK